MCSLCENNSMIVLDSYHECLTINMIVWCRFLILLVESCSKLEISVTEHLVEVVDKLSNTAVYMGLKMLTEHAQMYAGKCERC